MRTHSFITALTLFENKNKCLFDELIMASIHLRNRESTKKTIQKMKILFGLFTSSLAVPTPVIIGGKDAKDGDFPWQVTLKRASGSHYCGGSILNTNKVIFKNH